MAGFSSSCESRASAQLGPAKQVGFGPIGGIRPHKGFGPKQSGNSAHWDSAAGLAVFERALAALRDDPFACALTFIAFPVDTKGSSANPPAPPPRCRCIRQRQSAVPKHSSPSALRVPDSTLIAIGSGNKTQTQCRKKSAGWGGPPPHQRPASAFLRPMPIASRRPSRMYACTHICANARCTCALQRTERKLCRSRTSHVS